MLEQTAAQNAAATQAASAAAHAADAIVQSQKRRQQEKANESEAADILFRLEQEVQWLLEVSHDDPVGVSIVSTFKEYDINSTGLSSRSYRDLESKRTFSLACDHLKKLKKCAAEHSVEYGAIVTAYMVAGKRFRDFNESMGHRCESQLSDIRERITNMRASLSADIERLCKLRKVAVFVAAALMLQMTLMCTFASVLWMLLPVELLVVTIVLLNHSESSDSIAARILNIGRLESEESNLVSRMRERYRFLLADDGGKLIQKVHSEHHMVAGFVSDTNRLLGEI